MAVWMMRAVWIDEGSDPDYPKLKALAMTRVYFSARRTAPETVAAAKAQGLKAGLYRVPEWDAGLEPAAWAKLLADDVARLRPDAVQANIETHDMGWVAAFLVAWRLRLPDFPTSWALEGFQGGRIVGIRSQIRQARVRLVPECYDGAMGEYDSRGVVKDLTDWGFEYPLISPFYDAAKLRRGWDGFAFTQARLP